MFDEKYRGSKISWHCPFKSQHCLLNKKNYFVGTAGAGNIMRLIMMSARFVARGVKKGSFITLSGGHFIRVISNIMYSKCGPHNWD
jgi:hypothetical protein